MNPHIAHRGFTLLETVISIGIVAVGGLAVLALMQSSLAASSFNRDLVVVVNLVREGAEVIRAIRDSDGFSTLTDSSYTVDSDSNFNLARPAEGLLPGNPDIADCTNCELKFTNGRYLHETGGTVTRFKRLVTIADITGELSCVAGVTVCHKRITSTIEWSSRGSTRTYSVAVDLTDWR